MITVSGLTKHYGDRIAVHDMSFAVAAGRVTGFVGPNGAGKSTTMRMMVGLTRPDHGDARYHGVPYTRLLRPARIVGSVLDARCMHPGRTARNHLRATAALSAISADRIDEVLRESDSRARRTNAPAASRSACASASPWRVPYWESPRCCCSTNRPRPRPRRHSLVEELPERVRGTGRHGLRVESPDR
jgi:ABC-2 type transport system ATP-binding protein